MRVRFYPKRADVNTATAIFATISYHGQSFKIYTTESINPKYWNQKKQEAKKNSGFAEAPEFNRRLNNLKSAINDLFMQYRSKHNNVAPTPEIFKNLIDRSLQRGTSANDFLGYYDDFIKLSEQGKRINPRTGKPIAVGNAKGHKATLNHLKNFNKGKGLYFDDINLDFHRNFIHYLTSAPKNLGLNTVGANIARIKTVMNEAFEDGIHTNMDYKKRKFSKPQQEVDAIALNQDEVDALIDVDLSTSPRLDAVRDMFIVSCYTALRYSDLVNLDPQLHITDGNIKMIQTKTKNKVVIPVHPVVNRILKKRNGLMPKAISNQKFNDYLKEIAEDIDEFKRPVHNSCVKMKKVPEKWEYLSAHVGRRTFCTREYNAGTPIYAITAMSGHKTEKEFLRYIKVTPDEHAAVVRNLWEQRERKLKAVI